MAKATDQPRALSSEQLSELLGLIKGADSVELKLTVPETDQRSAARSLGLDVLDAEIRQVVFFDTPDLKLYQAWRRRQGATDPGQGRRLGRETAAGGARRALAETPQVTVFRRRGGRHARRIRVLRIVQGVVERRRR